LAFQFKNIITIMWEFYCNISPHWWSPFWCGLKPRPQVSWESGPSCPESWGRYLRTGRPVHQDVTSQLAETICRKKQVF
jgi:hypothetical protein